MSEGKRMGNYDDDEPEDTFWLTVLGVVILLGILMFAIWAVGMTS